MINHETHELHEREKSNPDRFLNSGLVVMPFGNSRVESQRDSGPKPKVARDELPWETGLEDRNPNGVVATPSKGDATPLGLNTLPPTPQGSSFLATLGWRTQSLWDCWQADFSSLQLMQPWAANSQRTSGSSGSTQLSPNV